MAIYMRWKKELNDMSCSMPILHYKVKSQDEQYQHENTEMTIIVTIEREKMKNHHLNFFSK